MTATTAPTAATAGTREAIRRSLARDVASLADRARQTRDRAEELLLRSSTVLAHCGEVQALLRSRPSPDDGAVRDRLADARARIAHLERALQSNRRIGMALGVLMARHQLTEEQAFDLLRRQSSRRNVKLAVLAEEVVYTGGL